MRTASVTSVVLILAFLAGGATFIQQRDTPDFALRQIARALETRDTRLLDRHVDILSVIDNAAEELAIVAAESDIVSVIDDIAYGSPAGEMTAAQLKPVLTTLAQDALIDEVIGMSDDAQATDSALTLQRITNHSSLTRAAVRDIVDVQREGSSARARILMEEAELDTAIVLTLQLERRDGTWKFVGLPDLADYVRTVGDLQRQRLEEEWERGYFYADWAEYLAARKRTSAPPLEGRGFAD